VPDPREELAALSAALRGHLEREARRGRLAVHATGLRERLSVPAPAPGAGSDPERSAMPPAEPGIKSPVKPAAKPAAKAASRPQDPPSAAPEPAKSQDESRGKKLPWIDPEPESADYAARMKTLGALATEAAGCTLCGLSETRNTVVFARGRARNRVMFIGEAPGGDEDRLGEPFVGRAGKLLDQILDATGFRRDEIYIANILKCRPPQNRDPKPDEIVACTPYLEQQIELVQPKILCALGKFAAQFLTGNPKAPIGKLRGHIHYYKDRIMVLPTYHPAALLRNPNLKRTVWEDFQLLRTEYLR
jgi:DNA polymerase